MTTLVEAGTPFIALVCVDKPREVEVRTFNLHVDHSPDDPLGTWPNMFYAAPSLRRTRAHLAPGGVLAVWSGSPHVEFVDALREVFEEVHAVPVDFRNAIDELDETNWIFLAR